MKKKRSISILVCGIILVGCKQEIDTTKYAGASLSSDWNAQATCQTVRKLLKDRGQFLKYKIDELYNSKCTVEKLSGSLLGRFSYLEPYSASWPNGVSVRVFVDNGSLRMQGISGDGIPDSWNK